VNPATALELADWRRATAALYARVREQPDPAAAHALWRAGRARLMSSHPQSPLAAADPMRKSGIPYWPYRGDLRWELPVEPVGRPQRLQIDTAKGADLGVAGNALVIDLNFLYHPSCRYDDRWVCPLAPTDNLINVPVRAGERLHGL
jgi:uncharacterized protein (DUF1684 family)